MSEISLSVEGIDLLELYGERNSKLNLLRKAFPDVTINSRGTNLKIAGDKKQTQEVKAKLEVMLKVLRREKELKMDTVVELLNGIHPYDPLGNGSGDQSIIVHGRSGKVIRAKTANQKRLVEAAENNDIVFAVGPAGTGKTYTAVALAVRALKNRQVKKIILTRPDDLFEIGRAHV